MSCAKDKNGAPAPHEYMFECTVAFTAGRVRVELYDLAENYGNPAMGPSEYGHAVASIANKLDKDYGNELNIIPDLFADPGEFLTVIIGDDIA